MPSSRPRQRLIIVQPYVPAYRHAFFSSLHEALLGDGVQMVVASPGPQGALAARGDALSGASWMVPTRGWSVFVAGRQMQWMGSQSVIERGDAVITGLLGTSPDTYLALAHRRRGSRVGLWGHVRSYVSTPNRVDRALERWQMRHCDHLFAYTPSGSDQAVRDGLPAAKVTTVMNSLDVTGLVAAWSAVGDAERDAFAADIGLTSKKVVAFVGGVDSSKRIDFFAAALDHLWNIAPDVQVLLAGQGTDVHLLGAAMDRGQVLHLGYVTAGVKAAVFAAADAIAMPGRIGLLAVEALATGLPIVSTQWPFHAPEADYLRQGRDVFFSPAHDPRAYATLLLEVMQRHAAGPRTTQPYPTIDHMVQNFRAGVMAMLA